MSSVTAPWTDEQVEALWAWQHSAYVHPYTCGNRDDNHPHEDEFGDHGVLRPTNDGWTCPFCDYRQDWAHAFSFGPVPDGWPDLDYEALADEAERGYDVSHLRKPKRRRAQP